VKSKLLARLQPFAFAAKAVAPAYQALSPAPACAVAAATTAQEKPQYLQPQTRGTLIACTHAASTVFEASPGPA
jgi:hypothetical protein